MSDPLTVLTAAVTGAPMPAGEVQRLVITTGARGGTEWEMTVDDGTVVVVRRGVIELDNAMVAVFPRVLAAVNDRPSIALLVEDSGNRLTLSAASTSTPPSASVVPGPLFVDNAAIDAAIEDVRTRSRTELTAETDSTETILLAGGQDDDIDALSVLLDGLPSDDDVTLPALRAAAAAGLRHGLWMGWAAADHLREHTGLHAAEATADLLARQDAGTLR